MSNKLTILFESGSAVEITLIFKNTAKLLIPGEFNISQIEAGFYVWMFIEISN